MKTFNLYYLLLLCLIWACGAAEKNTSKDASPHEHMHSIEISAKQAASMQVQHDTLQLSRVGEYIQVNGMIDVPPYNKHSIQLPIDVYLLSSLVLEGSKVKKGEVLAKISHPDLARIQKDFLEAKSQCQLYQAELERQEKLTESKASPLKLLEQAKSAYLIAQSQLKRAEAVLKALQINPAQLSNGNLITELNITSPMDGYVSYFQGNNGMLLPAGQKLMELVDTRHLHAELFVFENDLNKVKIGQKMNLYLLNESKARQAEIYLMGKTLDANRAIKVHGHLMEEDENLVAGQQLTAHIFTRDTLAYTIPKRAIISAQNSHFVFRLLEENTQSVQFEMLEVELLDQNDVYQAFRLKNGEILNASMRFAVHGSYALYSKLFYADDEGGHGH